MAGKSSRWSLSARRQLAHLLHLRESGWGLLRFEQFSGHLPAAQEQETSLPDMNQVAGRDGVKSLQHRPVTITMNRSGSRWVPKRGDPFVRLLWKPLLLALLLGVVGLLLLPFFRGQQQAVPPTAAGASVQVNVYPATPTLALTPGFAGLSIESADACHIVTVEKHNPVVDQLVGNFGLAIMRYGGSSVDNVSWSPDGTSSCSWQHSTFTKRIIDGIFTFARKVGWKVILGVNLKNGDPAAAADEAAYAARVGGSSLLGIELGNEPEFYGWSYRTYQSQWETFATRIKAQTPTVPLVGPAITYCCKDFFTPFLQADGRKLALAVGHWYPTFYRGTGEVAPTISNLLSSALMDRTVQLMTQVLATAQAQHLPFYLDETNAIAGTPQEEVGHSVAMALWAADYLFTAAQLDVAGMAFHGGYPGDGTSPLLFKGIQVAPQALYYGMLLFHYAAKGKLVSTYKISADNVTAHSVVNEDGTLRVILINKEPKPATVQINTMQPYRSASAIRLTGPSVPTTSAVMLGGTTIGADGRWKPKTIEPIAVRGALSSVSLPAESAVVLTYENGTAGPSPAPGSRS
jgi:hypothetical protein